MLHSRQHGHNTIVKMRQTYCFLFFNVFPKYIETLDGDVPCIQTFFRYVLEIIEEYIGKQ